MLISKSASQLGMLGHKEEMLMADYENYSSFLSFHSCTHHNEEDLHVPSMELREQLTRYHPKTDVVLSAAGSIGRDGLHRGERRISGEGS